MKNLLVSLTLFFSIFLSCQPSFGQEQNSFLRVQNYDVCMDNANFVYTAAMFRDQGMTKAEMVKIIKERTPPSNQKDTLQVIDVIYARLKSSPDELAQAYLQACLKATTPKSQ